MRMKFKRAMAGFLSILVAVSMIIGGQAPLLVKAEEPQNAGGGTEVFFEGDAVIGVSGNTITYQVGENQVNVEVGVVSGSGITATVSGSSIVVPNGSEDEVTFTLDENFASDTMEVKVYGRTDGFNTTLAVTDHKTTLAAVSEGVGLPSSLNFMVELKNNEGGSGEGESGGGGSGENTYGAVKKLP